MARIHFSFESGHTDLVAAIVRVSDGSWWNTSGTPAFEAYNAANIADYAIAMTEDGSSGVYGATIPSLPAGAYDVLVFEMAGASLAESDAPAVGGGTLRWDGSAVESVQTGDAYGRLGTPASASVSDDIASLQADTDNIQTRLPAALVGGRMDANVGAYGGIVVDTSSQDFEGDLTAVSAGPPATLTLKAGVAFETDILVDSIVSILSGTARGFAAFITANSAADPPVVTLDRSLPATAPQAGDRYAVSGLAEVNVASIAAGAITAAAIAAGALDGKGDWTTTASLSGLTVDLNADQSGVTIGTVTTLTGHTPQTGDSFARIGDNGAGLTDVTAATVGDKTGYALSAAGLDQISVADPGGVANMTTLPKLIVALFRRFYKKVGRDANNITMYADDGSTANATQAYTASGSDETVNAAS